VCSGNLSSGADQLIRGTLSFDPGALGEIPFDDDETKPA
jgi:hypothetical protein